MNTTFAAAGCFPFEVLDDVGDINAVAVDSGFGERFVENVSCRPDEGMSETIFLISGLLAHEHDRGARGTFTEDGLRCVLPKIAGFAGFRFLLQNFESSCMQRECRPHDVLCCLIRLRFGEPSHVALPRTLAIVRNVLLETRKKLGGLCWGYYNVSQEFSSECPMRQVLGGTFESGSQKAGEMPTVEVVVRELPHRIVSTREHDDFVVQAMLGELGDYAA